MSRTSQRERPIHQGHSRKYSHSEEQNNLLRAKILPYVFITIEQPKLIRNIRV